MPDVERHRPLGVRGIRLGLSRPAMLETQFRAILRAASAGNVRILLPFVTTAAEVDAARAILESARDALAREGVAAPRVSLGAMIEVPAAALTVDILAGHVELTLEVEIVPENLPEGLGGGLRLGVLRQRDEIRHRILRRRARVEGVDREADLALLLRGRRLLPLRRRGRRILEPGHRGREEHDETDQGQRNASH